MTITPATELFECNILPTPYKVLGQELLPFSVGHALLFEKLEIESISKPEELILAILVCCNTYAEFEKALQRRSFGLRLRLWLWQCRRSFRDPDRFVSALAVFSEYLKEGMSQPDYDVVSTNRGNEFDSKTPPLQKLRTVLMSKLNYRPEEVLNTPYSQAMWDYLTFFELEGAIVITDGRPGENTAALFENAEARIQDAIKKHEAMTRRN